MKSELVWTMEFPAAGMDVSPHFRQLPQRQCSLAVTSELNSGLSVTQTLVFSGCEAFRCTYLTASDSDLILAAYDRVISLLDSTWLKELNAKKDTKDENLRHLMICLDDGACYEVLCRGFAAA